jgi:protein-serine/threonine kinase
MITFPTDCWAPGMDLHVRRRINPAGASRSRADRREVPAALNTTALHRDQHSSTSPNQEHEAPRGVEMNKASRNPSTVSNITDMSSGDDRDIQIPGHTTELTTSPISTTPSSPTHAKKPGLFERWLNDSKRHSDSRSGSGSGSGSGSQAKAASDSKSVQKKRSTSTSFQALMGRDDSDSDSDEDPFGDAPASAATARAVPRAQNRGNSLARHYDEIVEHRPQLHEKYGICDAGLIGRGATAVVRVARRLEDVDGKPSEKLYAVKEFRKRRKDETEKEYIKKLTSEFCISASLNHPNVVSTVDLVQDEHGQWCEVMEYCPGGDLFHIIKSSCMTEETINCCFRQLLNGIGYLHSMGVAHRDIKPENLLMDMHGQLKITDFGVSDVFRVCWEDKAHRSKGLCGSEPYIAPEEFTGREYDGRMVDVWACGIVYYAMYFQSIPFRQANRSDPNYLGFLERRKTGAFEPFLRLPEGCRQLMYRILEPDASRRLTIEQILDDPWVKSIEICKDNCTASGVVHQHLPPKMQEAAVQFCRYATGTGNVAKKSTNHTKEPDIKDHFRDLRV